MKKLLLIEDNKLIAKSYTMALSKKYEVVHTFSAEEAEEIADEFNSDICLIDHCLKDGGGKKSGSESFPILKKKMPNTIFVLLSNYDKGYLKSKNISIENDVHFDVVWHKIDYSLPSVLMKEVDRLLKKTS